MANTWNKIKNKFKHKWKKRDRSRKKSNRRKSRKNNNSSHNKSNHNIYSPLKSQQNTTTTTRNTMSLKRSIHKKKSSKSNVFGCLTNAPKENIYQYNVQKPPINIDNNSNHSNNSNTSNITTEISPQSQCEFAAPSNSSASSNSSCSTLSIPTPKICEPEQLEIAKNNNNIISTQKSKPISMATSIRPISPSKSKTTYTDKYILENQSAICCGSICSDSMGGGIKNGGHKNNLHHQYDAICMTPTPNTICTPNTSSSEWINGNNHDYDIYEGVLEVENDKIIEEGDMSNYYYVDDDDIDNINNQQDIDNNNDDIDDNDDDDDIDNNNDDDDDDDDDMEQENKYRGSVVIQSPRDIVGEFVCYSQQKMDEIRGSMEEEQREEEMEQIENGLSVNTLGGASLIAAESQEILIPITPNLDIYHGIIHDQQFIDELNHELKRNGYHNPETVLQQLWDEQIESAQILKILHYFCQKKKIKLADNMNINGHKTPPTSIPIDRVDVIPGLQSLNIGGHSIDITPNGSREDEDDDIKYTAYHSQQQQYDMIELGENNNISPEQYIFDKMMNSMDDIDEDQISHHQHPDIHPHSVQCGNNCGNKPIIIYHEQSSSPHPRPQSVQYHEGPIRVTNESNNSLQNIVIKGDEINHIHNINNNGDKTASNTPSSSTMSGSKSSSKSPKSRGRGIANNNSSNTGSTISDELEWNDGDLFHDKYIVGQKINEGGFGSVWMIKDDRLYSKCVKIMDLGNDEKSQRRRRKACIKEFTMTKKAYSDEVAEVELFIDDIHIIHEPKAYLIMPYFEGKDLFEYIDDDEYFKKVSVQTMLHIFYKIAEKLYDLHYFKKIVHGDLKPENIMILQNNKTDEIEVEIIDYGIAKSIRNLSSDAKYLQSKGHFGTKGYVAPELMRESKYNRKIDVFSAGVVLYNMVTENCLFSKGFKYYKLSEGEYYKYLEKKFKMIKKKKAVIDILYSCLTYNPEERWDVKQLIQRYFHSKR